MPLPDSLHGNNYWNGLAQQRDEALVNSHMYGRRWRMGGLTGGTARAEWHAEQGGVATLEQQGLQIGAVTLLHAYPTTMRFYTDHGAAHTEVVTFEMEVDDIGLIKVFRHMLTATPFKDAVRSVSSRRADQRHGLSDPTDEELALVYTEMERGASGLHTLWK